MTGNIRNAYTITNTRGTVLTTIYEREKDSSTDLVLHGRGYSTYGLKRNQNLVYLLERFANSTPPSNPVDGQLWYERGVTLNIYDELTGWRTVVPPSSGIGFTINAGQGLTGGGLPTGSPLVVTVNVGAGTGITVAADSVSTDDGAIDHDNLSGYAANEHYDHSTITLTAGNGLTGGGTITATRSFAVNPLGTGIDVSASNISVSGSTRMLTTGVGPNVLGQKTFTDQILADTTPIPAFPAYGFNGDNDTGVYLSGINQLSFTTGATQRFRIESNGVLRSLNTTYESLVVNPEDIPNKRYVDTAASGIDTPTENTFQGTSTISGLDGNETYLVNVYGVLPTKSTGWATLSAITLRRGGVFPILGFGTIVDQTPQFTVDWFDGGAPTEAAFIAEMNGSTSLNCIVNDSATGGPQISSVLMTAVQITQFAAPGSPSALGLIELDNVDGNTSPLGSTVYPSIYTPLADIRFNGTLSPAGQVLDAGGNTSAALIFSQIGNDWLISGDPTDYELYVSTVSTTGSGININGTLNTWLPFASHHLFWLSKTSGVGPGTWTISAEIRQITDPTITTGPVTYTLRVEVII